MAIAILVIYLFKKPPLKQIIIFALILAAITIAAYYLYIPVTEANMAQAPIRLGPDSFDPSLFTQ